MADSQEYSQRRESTLTGNAIKHHLSMWRDPRVLDLMDRLGCSFPEAYGYAMLLTRISIDYSQDGWCNLTPRQLKRMLESDRDADLLFAAFAETGFIDPCPNGGFYVVDDEAVCGDLRHSRAGSARRTRESRARAAANTGNVKEDAQNRCSAGCNTHDDVHNRYNGQCNGLEGVTEGPVTPIQQLQPTTPHHTSSHDTPPPPHPHTHAGTPAPAGAQPGDGGGRGGAASQNDERVVVAPAPPSPPVVSSGFTPVVLADEAVEQLAAAWETIHASLGPVWYRDALGCVNDTLPAAKLAEANKQAQSDVKRRLAITDPSNPGYVSNPRAFATRVLLDAFKAQGGDVREPVSGNGLVRGRVR